jgi:hypothetical protein
LARLLILLLQPFLKCAEVGFFVFAEKTCSHRDISNSNGILTAGAAVLEQLKRTRESQKMLHASQPVLQTLNVLGTVRER